MSGPATKLTAFVARLPGIVSRVISGAVARTDKAWDGIGARLPSRGLPGEALLVAVVVGYAMVNVARSTLDKGIQKIHAVGVSGVSANSIHDGRDAIDTAFMTWNDGDERLRALVRFHPVTLARAQTVLELLLVPLTLVLFYGLLKWLRGRVGTGPRSAGARPRSSPSSRWPRSACWATWSSGCSTSSPSSPSSPTVTAAARSLRSSR